MTEPQVPEGVARNIFRTAVLHERCAELFGCLTSGGSATVDPGGELSLVTADQLAQMMPEAEEDDPLFKDGHGIDRIPVSVSFLDTPLFMVRADQFDALEDLLYDAREIVALVTPQGINWDDEEDRARMFARGNALWARMTGVLRGDE